MYLDQEAYNVFVLQFIRFGLTHTEYDSYQPFLFISLIGKTKIVCENKINRTREGDRTPTYLGTYTFFAFSSQDLAVVYIDYDFYQPFMFVS